MVTKILPTKPNPTNASLIVQSNKLIEARYNLTLTEQRIVFCMVSKIRRDDREFRELRIDIRELAAFAGVSPSSYYSEIKRATMALLSKPVRIRDPDGGELQVNWISSAAYEAGKGSVILSFDPKLKPYLLELSREFTTLNPAAAVRLSSQYSIRIYMLLKQYERIGSRKIKVQELRDILNIGPKEYRLYYDFKRRTILAAQKEFRNSDRIDIDFEFEEEKLSRKVDSIIFHITSKPTQETLSIGDEQLSAFGRLQYFGVGARKAHALLKAHGEAAVIDAINLYEERIEDGKVKDLKGGYLIRLIEEGAQAQTPHEIEAQAKNTKAEETKTRQKKQLADKEKSEIATIERVAELNLDWVGNLSVSEYEQMIESVVRALPTLSAKKRLREDGLEALSSGMIRSVFHSRVSGLREEEAGIAVAPSS